jgi:drug/metabolite transporter (DMT)-like permease
MPPGPAGSSVARRSVSLVDQGHLRRGLVCGIGAAVTFGASAPFATRLVEEADPQLLAGLLYAGAALALAPVAATHRPAEARMRRTDLPRLGLLVLAGGVLAPVALLVGLDRTGGLAGSLLLNLEAPFTALVAVTLFAEHLSWRATLAGAVIVAAAAALAVAPGDLRVSPIGVVCIAAACGLWALDNNLTATLTLRDPVVLVTVKAAAAGVTNLTVAALRGETPPAATLLVAALVLGAVSYGISVLLDAYALRALGAAREAALFATAPFAGAVLAIPVLDESLTALTTAALLAMAGGVVLLISDNHSHVHVHDHLVHDHRHSHDEHHDHHHPDGVDPDEPHSHPHDHEPLEHAHPHASDVHHRHPH